MIVVLRGTATVFDSLAKLTMGVNSPPDRAVHSWRA
jgi:hypothetical protein